MVRSVKFGGPGRIHSEVSGSRSKPYAVVARYESGSGGTLVPVEGHCSCPVGHNCKHTAAVLLAARHLSPEAADSAAGSAGEGASADVRRWLEDWPGAAPARPDARPAGPPEPGRDHLFYVVHRDETGGMRIDPYRAYLKQDGEIGRNVREYREGTASAEGGFVTAEDAAFLGRLGHYRRGIWPLRYDWPEQCEAAETIRLQYGVGSSFDYAVGEKLLTFAAAEEDHPEFARALPQFVSELRRMFTPEEIEEHLARVENERLQRAMDAMDVYDPELDDHAAPAAEARRFELVKELLTAPALGTS